MKMLRYSDAAFKPNFERLLAASSLFDPGIEERTRAIIESVRQRGDEALLDLTQRFDGAALTPEQLPVGPEAFREAAKCAAPEVRAALKFAAQNIAAFSRRSLRKNWSARNAQGARVGEKFDPFQRVGIYIPGGTAPLVSTALMTVVLARVAGCEEIVVCTPCRPDGSINPALLFALNLAGATEVYRAGGAQAVAALALGTKTIRKTQKIFGPGNAYVVAAKRLLFGHVAVDLLPGPSEVLVLADDSANPAFIAADLLAQAEHGSGYERVWLVTPSARLIQRVEREIATQLPALERRGFIERILAGTGYGIQTRDLAQAISLTNQIAPEHCEIMTRNASAVARKVRTAGAIFLGPWSPTVLGDYVAGPSHTLPTGGAGASFAGLTVDQFQRRTSVVEYSRAALSRSLATVSRFAEMEGLSAHGKSAQLRLEP